MNEKGLTDLKKLSFAGLLVTLGIVFGDLGTSPLYTMKAIVAGGSENMNELLIYGSLSCIFWTLTIQTTIKYVIVTLRADNRGEGGIFALFALLRRKSSMAAVLTMVGASTLLADGVITPAITVTSAVEGLRLLDPGIPVVPIVLAIFAGLFFIQQFGTNFVGTSFGPLMVIWFLMLAIAGFSQMIMHPGILASISPVYAVKFLTVYPKGFILLGAVFLCTTGAEALYSDLGHCGRTNIRITWAFVKVSLLLNYFGQGAWLINNMQSASGANPFFSILPEWFILPGVLIATIAAIIASQALISGSFTLVSEAISLNFWPKTKIDHPTFIQGQVYLPFVNWLLFALCSIVVISFRESTNMEAAYGLAITITMIMTTLLLAFYMYQKRVNHKLIAVLVLLFLTVEGSFLIANLHKFKNGGWFTLLLAFLYFVIMLSWYYGRKIKNRYITFSYISDYSEQITDLHNDKSVPRTATNLVYVIKANNMDQVESKVIYSILQKQPKRAETYWLLHINRVDEPDRFEYQFNSLIPGVLNRIDFHLGFKVEPRINLYFREVLEDLVSTGEIDLSSSYDCLRKHNYCGDFRFILIDRVMLRDFKLSAWENFILTVHSIARRIAIPEDKALHLDPTSTIVEQVPITIDHREDSKIQRVYI
ncbi:MAG: KUP/HAK/KT family potassium transporter [Bacteroidales bacterium]